MIGPNRAQKKLKMDSARPTIITWLTDVHGAAGSAEKLEVINLTIDLLSDHHWAGHDTYYKIFFPCDADVNVVDRQAA